MKVTIEIIDTPDGGTTIERTPDGPFPDSKAWTISDLFMQAMKEFKAEAALCPED